jgi:hypothetical protein
MAGRAKVTISFETTHELAMVMDWPRALGLLDPQKMKDLRIESFDLEVDGDTRLGPDDNQT